MSLFSLKDLRDWKISAADGEIGGIKDFYFDDHYWTVRYLVLDTGSWLRPGRVVLISPLSIRKADPEKKIVALNLTKAQVKDSPEIEADKPLGRRIEEDLAHHFGWPMYWVTGTGTFVVVPRDVGVPKGGSEGEHAEEGTRPEPGDPNLRSFDEVTGYHIQATDGEIGHAEDFLADDALWAIRYMVVDTRNWLPGRKVLVAPPWIDDISWSDRLVVVNLKQNPIETSPEYTGETPLDRGYEERLHEHYGLGKYWEAS
jgi:hypothetical protein